MLAGGFEAHYFRIFFLDRARLREHLLELPYRRLPGFYRLLLTTRELTREGETVGIWLATPRWKEGYEYAYYRAAYPLAGRRVLPLIDAGDRVLRENLSRLDAIVCWHCEPNLPGLRVIHRSPDGVVARR